MKMTYILNVDGIKNSERILEYLESVGAEPVRKNPGRKDCNHFSYKGLNIDVCIFGERIDIEINPSHNTSDSFNRIRKGLEGTIQ